MRKFLFVFAPVFLNLSAWCQNDLFTVLPKNSALVQKSTNEQSTLKSKAQNDPHLKKMNFVQLGNLPKIQKDGELTFTIPDVGKVTAKASRVEYVSEKNYRWFGNITGENQGEVFLFNDNGKQYGYINVDDKTYQLKYYGENLSILAEMDAPKMRERGCPNKGVLVDNKNPKTVSLSSARVLPCTQDHLRVLVVYTQNTLNTFGLQAIQEKVNLSIAQFNEAYRNSGITNPRAQLQLAALEQTNFVERVRTPTSTSDDIRLDVLSLPNFTETRRIATNADIVVCLTNARYSGYAGRGGAINAKYNEAFAIVEASDIPNDPVFPHEIGHLLGGRHQEAQDPEPDDAHGYKYVVKFGFLHLGRKTYGTIMYNRDPAREGDVQRAIRWSNPYLSDQGTVTGTTTRNNVARNIGVNANTIANFRPSVGVLQANILGSTVVSSYGLRTYEAAVSCGQAPYTYYWERSTDGFNYYGGTSGEFYGVSFFAGNKKVLFLRLRVRSQDGQTAMAYLTVNVTMGANLRTAADSTAEQSDAILPEQIPDIEADHALLGVSYPNPSRDEVATVVCLQESQAISLTLIDRQGTLIRQLYEGEVPAGKTAFACSVQDLNPGLYYIRISTASQTETKKILVEK